MDLVSGFFQAAVTVQDQSPAEANVTPRFVSRHMTSRKSIISPAIGCGEAAASFLMIRIVCLIFT